MTSFNFVSCIDIQEKYLSSLKTKKLLQSLEKAVNIIINLSKENKIILTGVGKSAKIADTINTLFKAISLTSYFINSYEALHGDLGIIKNNDLLIAISNSGETKEVLNLTTRSLELGVQVIAITKNKESTLGSLSQIVLELNSDLEECDPLKAVPSTSLLITLAIGNCLVSGVMQNKNFSEADYLKNHPGGSLGKKLAIPIESKLSKIIPINDNIKFLDIIKNISLNKTGITVVTTNNNKILGCITDGDIRRVITKSPNNLLQLTAKDIMTKNPKIVKHTISCIEAEYLMKIHKITNLIIRKNQEIFVINTYNL